MGDRAVGRLMGGRRALVGLLLDGARAAAERSRSQSARFHLRVVVADADANTNG